MFIFVLANAVGTTSPGITDLEIWSAEKVYVFVASPSELISDSERKGWTENASLIFFGLSCDLWETCILVPISDITFFTGLHLIGESAAFDSGVFLFSWSLALFTAWRGFPEDGRVLWEALFFIRKLVYKVNKKISIFFFKFHVFKLSALWVKIIYRQSSLVEFFTSYGAGYMIFSFLELTAARVNSFSIPRLILLYSPR